MTDISLISTDEVDREFIQLVEVIARVGDLPRLKAQPPHGLQDALKVLRLLRLGVRVVEPQVRLAAVERRVAKVDKDRLRVADVEEAVGLWGETRVDEPACRGEVLLAKVWVDLRVLAGLVEASKETF